MQTFKITLKVEFQTEIHVLLYSVLQLLDIVVTLVTSEVKTEEGARVCEYTITKADIVFNPRHPLLKTLIES